METDVLCSWELEVLFSGNHLRWMTKPKHECLLNTNLTENSCHANPNGMFGLKRYTRKGEERKWGERKEIRGERWISYSTKQWKWDWFSFSLIFSFPLSFPLLTSPIISFSQICAKGSSISMGEPDQSLKVQLLQSPQIAFKIKWKSGLLSSLKSS